MRKMMSNTTERTLQVLRMFFNNKEQLQSMVDNDTLKCHPSLKFYVKHVLDGTVDSLDMQLYSRDINEYHKIFLDLKEKSKPIHGNFYDDLRQRYFDLLNCTPIENPNEPLNDTHLAWMLTKLSDDTMSETKKHRWLGYIQGCMAYRGFITVNEERDNTREVFKGK